MTMPPDSIALRPAMAGDAAAISALVRGLAQRWIVPDCSEEGAAALLASMSEEKTRERLQEGYRYVVAERGDRIVGVAALRLPSHLYHLFVSEDAQRLGVARCLWEAVREYADPAASVTVNASRHARPVYDRFGFVEVQPEQLDRGILRTPMVWHRH